MLANQFFFGGLAPKPPWSASPKAEHPGSFCEAEQRFLLLFPEKEEDNLWSMSPKVGYLDSFCEAEQRFLLLFLEKEDN
jgi:hypothetical protein